jgi:hypothetical protein
MRGWDVSMFLIYVQGMKGPQPQKVQKIPTDGLGKPTLQVLAQHELQPDEQALTLKI